jgi:serine/threonine protein kinase
VPSKDIDEDQLQEFQQEVMTMASISHPRLAMLLGAVIPAAGSKDQVMIVLELLSGDMETILHRDRVPKKLTLFQRVEWAMQAAEGMAWLHGAGLIHRDMKPSNLLYSASSRSVKVADFGLAGLLGKGEVLEDGQMVGNPRFWAPEIIDRKPWSKVKENLFVFYCFHFFKKATDVYALGITMVTFVTRRDVFLEYWTGSSLRLEFLTDILENDLKPDLPSSPYKCPSSLRKLLERCYDKDPAKRPSCVEIADIFEREVNMLPFCCALSLIFLVRFSLNVPCPILFCEKSGIWVSISCSLGF